VWAKEDLQKLHVILSEAAASGMMHTLAMPASLRILLAAHDDVRAQGIRGVLAASTAAHFEVEHAPTGWEAQRQAGDQTYAALIVDDTLSDTDARTLLGRLRAIGVGAPALVLSPPGSDFVAAGGDDLLPWTEVPMGNTLVRAIMAMVQRHALTEELAAARDRAERATSALAELSHDLATPLGVVMGMTEALLSDDNGLNAEGRSDLEDVARQALRACEILKHLNQPDTGPGLVIPPVAPPREHISGPAGTLILIADDDAGTRRLVCTTLASDKYNMLEAADGKEAWRLIREHHPAIAILDWQMPVYSGLELTDVIKGDPRFRDMTVIMLTGRTAQVDREAGARVHADVFLTKPFYPHELVEAVERALRGT
jgi:DNA-binding response OmpR family regulator